VGLGDLQEYLLNLVNYMRLSNCVKFRFEFLPEEERILHYAASDLCIFPSTYEPFGIVVLEAMSMERPVVVGAAGVSGMREIVICCGEEQCGYHIDPNNPSDIAWGIKEVLCDPERAMKWGENGRKRVLQYFTWREAARQTLQIYESMQYRSRDEFFRPVTVLPSRARPILSTAEVEQLKNQRQSFRQFAGISLIVGGIGINEYNVHICP
jgi:glycosyltransferase involved in cell wall biosynthesis